jgi:hypothetical protein
MGWDQRFDRCGRPVARPRERAWPPGTTVDARRARRGSGGFSYSQAKGKAIIESSYAPQISVAGGCRRFSATAFTLPSTQPARPATATTTWPRSISVSVRLPRSDAHSSLRRSLRAPRDVGVLRPGVESASSREVLGMVAGHGLWNLLGGPGREQFKGVRCRRRAPISRYPRAAATVGDRAMHGLTTSVRANSSTARSPSPQRDRIVALDPSIGQRGKKGGERLRWRAPQLATA